MNDNELKNMRKIVKLTLLRIGIRCDLVGFSYLCYGVELAILQPELLRRMCNGLYTEISNHFHLDSYENVERSIRHAINTTCETKSFMELNRLLGMDLIYYR